MKCSICGERFSKNRNGFSDLLDNNETKRFLKVKKNQSVCIDCKKDLLYAGIITPFF